MAKGSLISVTRTALRECPREVFNWYLVLCTCIWSFSGVAKGFDEGNIASIVVMSVFRSKFGVAGQSDSEYADTKGWIVSISTAGAVFGCLACTGLTERLGRRLVMQIFTVLYIAGVLGQTLSNGNLSGLYASRFIAGTCIGTSSVLPLVYLSEIAPRQIRGLLTLQYSVCQQLGLVFGFFINYGVTRHYANQDLQWQLPTVLQVVPAVIWGLGTFITPESPRFLLVINKPTEALKTLARLRNLPETHEYVQTEFRGIQHQLEHEVELVAGATKSDLLKETFTILPNRRRFVLMFLAHVFSQWSGANAIVQYSPTIFGYLGIDGTESTFLATGIYAIVKFVSTLLFAIFIIDFVGRRRSLMTGIVLQIGTLVFVGAYLAKTNGMSAAQISASPSAKAASTVSIVAIYLHAVGWSIGWYGIPYLLSAEVFPVRIRSLNVSILMAFHWALFFGCSRAMPSLLVVTHRYGAFFFFASICCISLVYVYFAMPETAGRSLESMDSIFQRPWYTVYKVAYPRPEELVGSVLTADEQESDRDAGKSPIEVLHRA